MLTDLSIKTMVKKNKKQKYAVAMAFDVYEIIGDDQVCIPFAYSFQQLELGFPNIDRDFPEIKAKFGIPLFDRQKEIREETLEILNDTHSIIISLAPGWGKTLYSIYLACKIGLKTLIYCHRVVLVDQWKKSIIKACGKSIRVQILDASCKVNPAADFYIINIVNVPKRNINDFINVGLFIDDECHTSCTEKFSKAFGYVFPKYSIGLTATPVRSDGKDRILELFFGPNIIYRPMYELFNVYLFNTGFMPETTKTVSGDLNWNSVLVSQSMNQKRNEQLIDIVRYFGHRNILITCKRKDHVNLLVKGLLKYGVDADSFMGSNQVMNFDCRVLVVTYSKGGVGMDAPKLDMLLVAGDAEENFPQYQGRVFRREWHCPIIIDPIDKFYPLKQHSDVRKEIYTDSGGEVKNLLDCFPSFTAWRKRFATDLTDVYGDLEVGNNTDDEE
jgi:superfamily II DNA or RNA helicase